MKSLNGEAQDRFGTRVGDPSWSAFPPTGQAGRAPSLFLRAWNCVGVELGRLLGPMIRQLRTRGWRAVPVTTVLLLVMLSFTLVPTDSAAGSVMRSASAESAVLPWWQAVLRLPASILAPASNLPAWGAFAQVTMIAAAAETLIGWRRMLLVGLITNAAATGAARVMAWLGPNNPAGISAEIASQPDTGPSVFVTAVSIYLCIVQRTPIVRRLTSLAMIAEVSLNPNLAGREHLIGMAAAALLAVTLDARSPSARRQTPRPRRPTRTRLG